MPRLTTWRRYRREPYTGDVTWTAWQELFTLTTEDPPGTIQTSLNPIRQFLTIPEGVQPSARTLRKAPVALYNHKPGYFKP